MATYTEESKFGMGATVKILKAIGFASLFLSVGLIGTLAIIVGANAIIDAQTKVKLPSSLVVFTDAWERGFVFVEGTFTIDNDRSAFPIQTSAIRCSRDSKSCTVATAQITFGDVLNVELSSYGILLWNDTTIQFYEDDQCVQYIYSIDRANKRVLGTRTKKPNVSGCENVEDKPLSLSLVNGLDVWSRLNQEAVARVSPFMWSGIAELWLLLVFFGWRWRQSYLSFIRGHS